LRQIILVRHAKVLIHHNQRIPASQMRAWVEQYNQAPIDRTLPEGEVIEHIKTADVVLASSLSRSADSLDMIGVKAAEKNRLFDELDVPSSHGTLIKLSPKTWLVILRLLMLFGIGKNSKTFKVSKDRAKEATDYLLSLAQENQTIVLMGHGGMNWLLGRELEKLDYRILRKCNASKNWGYTVYTSP